MSDSLRHHGLQHTRPPCPSPIPGVYSNSWPPSRWCYPIVSSSVVPFSSSLQCFPASGAFPRSQFFASGGQNIGVSALASLLPMNIQDWFSLGLTGWISMQPKGLSRVFSNIIIQKLQFFSIQPSLWSSSHLYDCWKDHSLDYMDLCQQSDVFAFWHTVIAFLPRNNPLLISWLQSPSTVILEPKKRKSVTGFTFSPSICHALMWPIVTILVFWMLSFKQTFSLYPFTIIQRLY